MTDCLPVIAFDIEEKTRIAKMASATLHKLHDAIQRMKEWRDDSVKLKSSILRMKMDLQGDSEGDKLDREEQQMDPLITYQKAQINRLERANSDLENQVKSLKQALDKAEGDVAPIREMVDLISRIEEEFAHQRKRLTEEILRLRRRLREAEASEDQISITHQHQLKDMLLEYAKGDRTIEIVLANTIGRIVETVVSLSEELVYVSEDLCRFKTKNRNLHLKLDRLRAMLRTRCGSASGYRKRIGELSDIAARLLGEMDRLKLICENAEQDDIPDVLAQVERLMNELRNSLRNEREAMIAAGNPDCLKYMRKVIDLRVDLRVLSVELKRSNALIRERPRENMQQAGDCWRTVSLLNDFLRRIDVEIERMRVKPMHKYCRIGGVSGTQYAAKIAELESIVKRSIGVVAAVKHDSAAIVKASGKTTEMLANSIERLCAKIKDLEVLDDRTNLRDRIDRLEASAMCLKLELTARDQRIRALNDEHAAIRSSLERDRERREKIVADIRAENENLRGDISNRKRDISELSRKSEHLEQRAAAEMQLMRTEIKAEKKRLQDLHEDRESLLQEKETMRNLLRGRVKELEAITSERGRLDAEVTELKAKLEIASDENAKLKSIIADPEMAKWSDKTKSPMAEDKGEEQEGRDNSGEDTRERTRELQDELERLKAQLNETKISLNEANEHLRRALDKAADDRARLEDEISDLKSNEQSLTHRLSARTDACEEATKESERTTVENKALANKVKQLRNENEQLAAQLSEMGSEKGRLARAMAHTDNELASLQERVHDLKSERNKLQEQTSEREATAESLKFQLEMMRVELRDAGVEATRLRSENARFVGELETASVRNSGAEERVQALLTEKNELMTRINELNGEGAGLRERLNKAEAENEYFSIELNKSRLENDRLKARNALLQVTCDKRERDNGALSMENSTTRQRFNEISSEYRIITNQLGIQQMKYEALRFAAATLYHENNDLKGQLKKTDTRYQFTGARDDMKRKCRDTAAFKIELSDRELKTESDIAHGAIQGNRAKTKPKPGEVRSLAIGNKAWKLEVEQSENQVLTESEPASTKSGSPLTWTEGPTVEEIVGSFLGKHEVINICYKTDTDDYFKYPNDPLILGDEERWSTMVSIDRFEVENAALKMELNVLRNSLNCSQMNGEKTKNELDKAAEEIQALKVELMNLRDEKTALRSRLETFKEELNALRSERAALKDELAASRKSNFDFRLRANDLRAAHEKLKEVNAGLEGRLQDALKRANEFVKESETPNKS
jgi:chromosome segregation ATPase